MNNQNHEERFMADLKELVGKNVYDVSGQWDDFPLLKNIVGRCINFKAEKDPDETCMLEIRGNCAWEILHDDSIVFSRDSSMKHSVEESSHLKNLLGYRVLGTHFSLLDLSLTIYFDNDHKLMLLPDSTSEGYSFLIWGYGSFCGVSQGKLGLGTIDY